MQLMRRKPSGARFGGSATAAVQTRARRALRVIVAVGAFAAVTTVSGAPRSEVVSFGARNTYYHEGTPYGKMTVFNPSADLGVKPWDFLKIRAGWQADVVSGASIKTRNAQRGQNPDAISTASVKDLRQVVGGGIALNRKYTSLEAGYAYSWENDYRSHSFDVTAKAELLQRSMELSIAYARNWDEVCDRIQVDPDPTRRLALEKHDGCFKGDSKTTTTHPIAIDAIQGGWTQAWTPTFTTQVTGGLQVMNGFLSNPYREVNIGIASPVQEHIPDIRIRYAAGIRANLYIKPIKTAVRVGTRLYRDTWDIKAFTIELEAERYIIWEALRVRARGRLYRQSHAVFYSDDYLIQPRGAYWTGDRELSQMQSILAGLRLLYGPSAGANKWLGLLEKIELSVGGDLVFFKYDDFTINGDPLKKTAIIASLGLTLLF
jgi:hypothetical protein